MTNIRTWHTYLGILIAPSVLFFALTGALQLFHLHEAHGSYKPPTMIEKLARVHKDQVFAPDEHHPATDHEESGSGRAGRSAADDDHQGHHGGPPGSENPEDGSGTWLLKWYFLAVALALTLSTSLGLWIGLTHLRHKRTARLLLCLGIILPVLMLLL